jgi:hypothetical protein
MSRLAALFLAVFAQLRSVLPFAGGEIRGPRSGSKRLSATANMPISAVMSLAKTAHFLAHTANLGLAPSRAILWRRPQGAL